MPTGADTSWDPSQSDEHRENVEPNYRKLAWAVDSSLVSGALALFSALPLSTNPTERRWPFATSTVAVIAASWEVATLSVSSLANTCPCIPCGKGFGAGNFPLEKPDVTDYTEKDAP